MPCIHGTLSLKVKQLSNIDTFVANEMPTPAFQENVAPESKYYITPSVHKMVICDALRNLVPLVQLEHREKHSWMSVTFSEAAGVSVTKSNTLPWVFFTFFKLCK